MDDSDEEMGGADEPENDVTFAGDNESDFRRAVAGGLLTVAAARRG